MIASYLAITFSRFTTGQLSVDDAATYFVAVHPLRDLLTLPVASQGQPPLFFMALHEWIRFGDAEAVLRALPLVFMTGAAVTLLCTRWLQPETRVVSTAVLLLSAFSGYLTLALRPYSLSVWFSLWSCLLCASLLRTPRRGVAAHAWYVAATVLLGYSLTLAVWTLVAQGLCVIAATAVAAADGGLRRAIDKYGALWLSLAIVAVIYLPHGFAFLRFQAALEQPALPVTLAAAVNPRGFVSGPVYLLAMPAGLGYLALALAAVAVWSGARDRDPLVGLLVAVVVVQIGATHGSVAGRYGFSFRYLAPAYPALCLLVGLGAGRCLSGLRGAHVVVAGCAACVLAAAVASFVRAPDTTPNDIWRQVADDLRRMPGKKLVFFDSGWDVQPLRYEARHDPDVQARNDDGPGWNTFGREITPAYVARVIDREAGPGTLWFYDVDAARGSRIYDEAFVPGMRRHGCVRVYERAVVSNPRSEPGNTGTRLYGYACSGT